MEERGRNSHIPQFSTSSTFRTKRNPMPRLQILEKEESPEEQYSVICFVSYAYIVVCA